MANGSAAGSKRSFEPSANGALAKKSRPNDLTAEDMTTVAVKDAAAAAKIECFDDEDVEIIPFEMPEYEDSDSCPADQRQANQPSHMINEEFVSFNFDQSSYSADPGLLDEESGFNLKPVRDYMNDNPKVACVVEKLASGKLDLTRQSSDIRLFGSIMYDLGKMLSRLVRIPDKSHPETKSHFTQAFHIVCLGLPGLDAISQEATSFKETFRGLTLKAHLRCQLYSAFKNALGRLIKSATPLNH